MTKLFLMGGGRVARALALSLDNVVGGWARNPQQASELATITKTAWQSGSQWCVPPEAEAVVLAVRDEAVGEIARTLPAKGLPSSCVVFHCSGAHSSAALLGDLTEHCEGIGVFHPLCAVDEGRQGMFAGVVFGIEGDQAAMAVAQTLASALGGTSVPIPSQSLPLYHAAAVMASNYIVGLLHAAESILDQAGIDSQALRPGLTHLALGAVQNVQVRGLPSALTGPIRRGDLGSVAAHLQALSGPVRELYRQCGLQALKIAEESGELQEDAHRQMRKLLGDAPTSE